MGKLFKAIFAFTALIAGLGALGWILQTPKAQKVELTAEQKSAEAAKEARFQSDVRAVRALKAGMKNPDSFTLESALQMDDGTLCVTYRATNSFNAIVPGHAVVTGGKITTSDGGNSFVAIWNARCGSKRGVDVKHLRMAL